MSDASGGGSKAKRSQNHWMGDHYPTCPSCGNTCGKLAQVCADCGAILHVDTTWQVRLQSRGVKDRLRAAEHREAEEARKGKAV